MDENIHAEYERRRAAYAGEFARSSARGSTLTQVLLLALVVLVFLGYQGMHQVDRAWWAAVPVGVMIGLTPGLLRARRAAHRAARLLEVYESGLARLDGTRLQSGHTGEAFREAGHLYERDLDILGPDSIFGMLATTRTAVGQRALARLLLHPETVPQGLELYHGRYIQTDSHSAPTARPIPAQGNALGQGDDSRFGGLKARPIPLAHGHDGYINHVYAPKPLSVVGENVRAEALTPQSEVLARQGAVRELAPMLDLRERVALLGRSAFAELPAESFDRWLNRPLSGLAMWMRWLLVALTLAWMALLAAGLMHRVDMATLPRNLAALLALQGAFALWLRPRVTAELEAAHRLAGQTAILREGLRVAGEQRFESGLLRRLQKDAAGGDAALKRLSGSLMLVEQRAKEWYYAPALLLAVGTHAAISLELWKSEHGKTMRRWVAAWAEFEAMLALSTYAAEHEENAYPEMLEGEEAIFAAVEMVHPLLPRGQAVANHVRLDAETRFLLISGSNMAGKSTLLRAIGTNAVLAQAGAPVSARSLTMSALRVGASLALVDSLAEGKSKFLAEVERLRDLVELAKEGSEGHCLFLIDEIFSGTNSADRRAAAEAVLRGLTREGAIGALSTHDLALAELAEVPELGGLNVHMASAREDDPLAFDYLLKPGVNRTTNAMAIVRLLGLAE